MTPNWTLSLAKELKQLNFLTSKVSEVGLILHVVKSLEYWG